MKLGLIVSAVVAGILCMGILAIMIPFDKKYVVRHKGKKKKIDYKKTDVFFRWNVFDMVSCCIAIYAILCVESLFFLIMSGYDIENNYVQFFLNQSQVWVIVGMAYLFTRVSMLLKGIKERFGETKDE